MDNPQSLSWLGLVVALTIVSLAEYSLHIQSLPILLRGHAAKADEWFTIHSSECVVEFLVSLQLEGCHQQQNA